MKLQQRGLRLLESWGPAGAVGLLLLLAALAWQGLVNQPRHRQAKQLQAELLAQANQATQPLTPASGAPASAQPSVREARTASPDGPAALAAFEARLPRLQELPQLLARIDQGAAAQRVELRAGEYRLERVADERWLRYRITLPVRARYAQVRGLVDHVLVALPTAALEDVDLLRDGSDAQAPLQARLRFTLYLRP